MRTPAILIPLGLMSALLLGTFARGPSETDVAQGIPVVAPTMETASLPAVLPPARSTPRSSPTPEIERFTRAPATLPTRVPASLPEPTRERPSPTPTRAPRPNCDPAYPDDRTCIPPGPPFDQGCAITDQRLFTVLPPDPQRLDHDKDGIGCEPIT